MFCEPKTLVRALLSYRTYEPTASEHLRECRERWIPVCVKRRVDKARVRAVADSVLTGTFKASEYEVLREEHRIAVALVLMQGWSEHLQRMIDDGAKLEITLTQRVFKFLAYIPLDHATLAVRNWGTRDGGKIRPMELIMGLELVRIPEFMAVYLAIHAKWRVRGYDWDRRAVEEAARTHAD